MSDASFDLLEMPWIPCSTPSGAVEVGLRRLFREAHQLGPVRHASPLVEVGIYRLLLAILHRVVDGPRSDGQWRALWERGCFDADLFDAYFDRWRERFDLLHPRWPFFQVGGFVLTDSEGLPTSADTTARLAIELASGNNATLFSHEVDSRSRPIFAGEAARQMLAAQCFSLGGGQGPTSLQFQKHPYASHAPLVGRLSVWVTRETLFETVLANVVRYDDVEPFERVGEDQPCWERQEARAPGAVRPAGYLDLLTFPARYMRFSGTGSGTLAVVQGLWIAPGLSLPSDWSALNEPMVPSKEVDKIGIIPVSVDTERAVWRDAVALLSMPHGNHRFDGRPRILRQAAARSFSRVLGRSAFLSLCAVGIANDKAKPLLWRRETLPASVRLLEEAELVDVVRHAVQLAEQSGTALDGALYKLASEIRKDEMADRSPDKADLRRLSDAMQRRASLWAELEGPFHAFLRALPEDPDGALRAWADRLVRTAREAFRRGATAAPATGSRLLRAQVLAERTLQRRLQPIRDITNPNPEVTP